MNELEEVLAKYNVPQRIVSNKEAINEIESKIGFNIPEDYKCFLLNYHGFENSIGEEYVSLWDLDEIVEQNEGYLVIENLPSTIGIGSNGASELIALAKNADGNLRVVLTPLIDLSEEFYIQIGYSFTDFLLRLDKGQEWFSKIEG
jgi:hypothetical protein